MDKRLANWKERVDQWQRVNFQECLLYTDYNDWWFLRLIYWLLTWIFGVAVQVGQIGEDTSEISYAIFMFAASLLMEFHKNWKKKYTHVTSKVYQRGFLSIAFALLVVSLLSISMRSVQEGFHAAYPRVPLETIRLYTTQARWWMFLFSGLLLSLVLTNLTFMFLHDDWVPPPPKSAQFAAVSLDEKTHKKKMRSIGIEMEEDALLSGNGEEE